MPAYFYRGGCWMAGNLVLDIDGRTRRNRALQMGVLLAMLVLALAAGARPVAADPAPPTSTVPPAVPPSQATLSANQLVGLVQLLVVLALFVLVSYLYYTY